MSYCPNCKIDTEGYLCNRCGNPLAQQSPGQAERGQRLAGAGCYALGPLSAIYYLQYSDYRDLASVRFHAWQSMLFSGAAILLYLAWWTAISLAGQRIQAAGLGNWDLHPEVFLISMGLGILGILVIHGGILILWIVLMAKAYAGAAIRLPILGAVAATKAAFRG